MGEEKIIAALDEDEKRSLLIALAGKHEPGVVGAQTFFHGKPNHNGMDAHRCLLGLKQRGLLSYVRTDGPDSITDRRQAVDATTAHYYRLTALGQRIAVLLRDGSTPVHAPREDGGAGK